MATRKLGWALAFALLLALLAAARGVGPARDIPAGTGYAALELCSRSFVSGEAFDHVRARYVEPAVRPLPWIWSIAYQPGVRVEVHSVLPTLRHSRTSIFRAGLGCTVLPPGTSEERVRAQPFRPAAELADDPRPWPLGEGSAERERLGDSLRGLVERHAETIFGETSDDPARRRNTTALLVAHDGRLVFERYGQGYTRAQPQLGWSMTKSLTAILAGAFVRDGKLSLDQPVGLPRWQGTPKRDIRWRQLLNMAPGLAWFEGYRGESDVTEMLFSQADQGAWAADRPLTSTPGSVFTYSTGFSNIAMLRLRQLLGGDPQALYDYTRRRLFEPLGIRHGVIEPDASGTPIGGARGFLRPVDWLRLGQLVANGGRWNGGQLLPRDYVAFLTAPSPASAGYGGSIWRVDSEMVPSAQRPRLPGDLVWFAGHLGQLTVIVPSLDLVVLRMGVSVSDTMEHSVCRDQTFALVADLAQARWPGSSGGRPRPR